MTKRSFIPLPLGGGQVGERERGVAVVSVPEDVEIVVDAAVATCLVVGVVDVVVDDVGEAGVECTAVCRQVRPMYVEGVVGEWKSRWNEIFFVK